MCVHIGEPSNVDLGMCLHADAVLRLSVSYVSVSLNNPTVVSFLLFCAVCVCVCVLRQTVRQRVRVESRKSGYPV